MSDDQSDPDPNIHIVVEMLPVCCPNPKCRKPFEEYTIVYVKGLKRLMTPGTIIYHIKMACAHCGKLFYWNEDDKSLQNDADVFIELLSLINGQK